MNGIHDLGGMDGFGPVQAEPETEEPVFHAAWEGRVYGMVRSLGRLGLWNIDKGRYARERQHPLQYLGNSYYESWLAGLYTQLVEAGLVTAEELASGRAESSAPESLRERVLRAGQVSGLSLANPDYNREAAAPPRYKAGDAVRALNRRRPGHTREPRYVLGRVGVVHEHYGAHVYADLSAQGVDEGHHLYCVRFDAEELWGDSANSNSVVYVDLFEDYLAPAESLPPSARKGSESLLPSAGEGSESPLPSAGEG